MTRRILGVALLSSVIALVLFLVPLAIAVFNLFLADAQATLERDALHAAVVVDSAFSGTDRAELPAASDGNQLGLYDAQKNLIGGTGPQTADAATRQALSGSSTHASDSGWIISVVPISSAESVTGAVRAAAPLGTVWLRTVGVWLLLLLAAAVAVTLGIVAARSLARRITRPMERLTLASQALGDGDFEVRTTPSGLPEIDRAGEALNSTAARLGDLVQRERQLAADASHQLRTPLTGLRLVLEGGLSDPDADLRGILRQAIEQADQLDGTIDDLITLNRGAYDAAPSDAYALVGAAERRWHAVLAAAGRPLRVAISEKLLQPVVVESAFQQIVDVLIENALRHGTGEVILRVREAHGAVAVDVEDEGNTIAVSEDIFGSGVSPAGGSGLGLALARRLAEDQGGRLLLSTRVPHTQFTLILPAAAPAR